MKHSTLLTFALLIMQTIFSHELTAQTINTIVKTGFELHSKDWHGSESNVKNQANDLACDTNGNIYYATNSKIVKIDILSGTQSVIAGQSAVGYSGDGGPAVNAYLRNPKGLVFDKNNNLIFSDEQNFRIRKINLITGIIETIGGSGVGGYSGDGGLAINAKIGFISGVAIDTMNNVLLCDFYHHVIRHINTQTGIITTFAGSTSGGASAIPISKNLARFSIPYDVAVYRNGDVFIAEKGNKIIRKIDAQSNLVSIFGGSPIGSYTDSALATSCRMFAPNSICFDDSDNLYVLDFNHTLKRINLSDNKIYRIAGQNEIFGFAGDGKNINETLFNNPIGIAFNKKRNSLIINDQYNNRIREISSSITAPLVDNYIDYCLNDSAIPLSVIGTNIKWYDKPIGGIPMLSSPKPATNLLDTFTYFVSQTIGGKESFRNAMVVRIHGGDTIFKVQDYIEFCFKSTVDNLSRNVYVSNPNNYIKYFYDPTLLDSVLHTPSTLLLKDGKRNYYCFGVNEFGCKSNVDSFEVRVKEKTPIPKYNSPLNLCQGQKREQLKADGYRIIWLSSPNGSGGTYGAPSPPTFLLDTFYYYLYQIDSLGCYSDIGTFQVNINPLPQMPIINTPIYFCQNDTNKSLNVANTRLLWSTIDSVVLGDSTPKLNTSKVDTISYLVNALSDLNCRSFITRKLDVIIKQQPIISSTVSATSKKTGQEVSIKATSDSGVNYLWSNGSTDPLIKFTPSNAGKYSYWVYSISTNGCPSDTSWQNIDIDTSYYWDLSFSVYPIPFKNHIKISGVDLKDVRSLNLYNLAGARIIEGNIPLKSLEMDIPEYLPSGYYLLEINTIGSANPTKLIYKE